MNKLEIIKNRASFLRGFLLDTVFPVECLGCRKEGVWICPSCFDNIPYNESQYCPYCHQASSLGQTCRHCKKTHCLDGLLVAGDYKNRPLASMIKSYKYYGAKEVWPDIDKYLSGFISRLLATAELKAILGYAWIVPVPLHPRRYRWRGFNQAEEIAKSVAEKLNLEISIALARTRYAKAQAKISIKKRRTNVRHCFSCIKNVKNKQIILLDDVTTTGSTLEACARVLKQNQAREVWGLVIARG